MFELLTTDEFAEWFSALDDRAAEDVAATLEVVVQLGTRTEAPGSSEWLLWYEHPCLSASGSPIVPLPYASPALVAARPIAGAECVAWRFLEDWGIFLGYMKRVIKHLESPQFVARLNHLDRRDAAAVAAAVARIRRVSKSRQLALSEFQQRRRTLGIPSLKAEDAPALERFTDLTALRESYFAALAAAGFSIVDVPAHSPALREIALRSRAPGLRLLYGVDTPRNRGLAALGEWLDRSFYGDSVRRAEQQWRQFLDGRLAATHPARPR